jgi:hypothetical protein
MRNALSSRMSSATASRSAFSINLSRSPVRRRLAAWDGRGCDSPRRMLRFTLSAMISVMPAPARV